MVVVVVLRSQLAALLVPVACCSLRILWRVMVPVSGVRGGRKPGESVIDEAFDS